MPVEYIDRPPRIQPELPIAEVEIPQPPELRQNIAQNTTGVIVSVVSMIGFLLASGSNNLALMLPMGFVMIISVAATLLGGGNEKREYEKKKKAYLETLAALRQEMTRHHNAQRAFYLHNYPEPDIVLEIAAQSEKSRFGPRIWERRPTDSDFGLVRLGLGTRPSSVIYHTSGMSSSSSIDEGPLWKDARKLANDSRLLTAAPITIPLRPTVQKNAEADEAGGRLIPGRHALGIYGKDAATTGNLARAVLAHFTIFHSAADARLFVVGAPASQQHWEWAEWLPHCAERGVDVDDEKTKASDQLCFAPEKEKVSAFWKRIKKELDARQVRLRESGDDKAKASGDVTLPFLLVVVDLLGDIPPTSPLADISSDGTVNTILQNGPALGAAIIFLAPTAAKIPGDCQALIEVASAGERVVFRYTEVGFNTPRYLGEADQLTPTEARSKFAARIRRLDLKRSAGADLPRSVDLLQMQSILEQRRITTVDKLTVQKNWAWSIEPKNAEWLSTPIGLVSSRDVRSLVFSAKEGGDGVHGMIAGTTGSGKSELLLTLIAGLAVKYDPRIVNFVLVDYKGGAAFEPFRRLPHTVDILTNLQANAVERMFTAIEAVMAQRSAVLAKSGMKDLVEYRAKAPYLRDASLPKTFPHLFIIVDEFAEMITQNPDYRAKFESITRLGRAFGVSLILATQRPAGVVSDQMRANMKFRICLRVETPDDSKELLGQPEAAFLPNLGGRGYIQVGNDVLTAVQVARAGGDYTDDRKVTLKDVIWLDDEALPSASESGEAPLYTGVELGEVLGLKPGEAPGTLVDWIVGIAALRAQRDGVPPQKKPWPNPLPDFLSLTQPIDAEYLNTERAVTADQTLIIDEAVGAWLTNAEEKPLWAVFDWRNPKPLRADIGLVDNPFRAEQRLLTIDLSNDPLAVFGSPGRGKTTFVKTLLTVLAAQRSPAELNIYALDFGRGGLKAIKTLPHVGAVIDPSETARVDQLLRMMRNIITERQERLQKFNSLAEYNLKHPGNVFPDVVVVIDNFAEFKENFEHLIPDLMGLIRDGRAFGVFFVITASTPNDLGGKLYNLLTQRLTFTQADSLTYTEVVGMGAPRFDNVPGRGLTAIVLDDKAVPMEFQLAVPGWPPQNDSDQPDPYQLIAQRMETAWLSIGGKRPSAELPRAITLLGMFELLDGKPITRIGELEIASKWRASMEPKNSEWLRAPVGLVSSKEVKTMVFQAQADGVHGMAAGTTGSGKSELLQTLISAMAIRYDPRIVNFVLVDYKGGPTVEPFRKLPHCVDIATNLEGNKVERIFVAINAEMNRRSDILAKAGVSDLVEYRKKVIPTLKPGSPFPDTFPHLFIIVDEFAEMIAQNPEYKEKFESITRLGRSFGVSLILATQRPAGVVTDQMRSNMKFRICLRVETPEDSKELLKRPDAARLPQIGGRGYVQAGTDSLTELQAAWSGAPYNETDPDPAFGVEEILAALEKQNDPPRSLLGWLVGALAAEAKRQGIPKQFKPWPDSLPENLPLNLPINAEYLPDAASESVVLNPAVEQWASAPPSAGDGARWQSWNWERPLPLRATVGLVDDPFHSNQRLLTLDVASDPIVVFGASGRGKSTFIKTLLLSLAAQRPPSELNFYALDFGRGGLKSLRALPHLGASIDASQSDRVESLFRMIRSLMNERQEKLSAATYASLEDYNAQHRDNPDVMFPAVLVVIDNFAEFKENYEYLTPDLLALVRDGRQFGIYFLLATSSPADIPGKLFNLLGQRLTFTLADPGAIPDIVGRGALSLANVPGRGLINIEGQPLEFHVAMPVLEDEKDAYARLAERMDKAWAAVGGKRPSAEIPRAVTLLEMYARQLGRKLERVGDLDLAGNWKRSMEPKNQEWLRGPVGLISSKELRTMIFSAQSDGDGVHGMVAGTTGSGKSEFLQTLIASLAIKYDPRIVNFVLIDYKGGAAFEPFRQLPHTVDIATNLEGNAVERIFIAVKAEMDRRSDLLAKSGVAELVKYRKEVIPRGRKDLPDTFPHLFIIVDEFAEMIAANPDYRLQFESITRLGRAFGVTLILATQRPAGAVSDQMRANMKFRVCLRVETADDSKELLKRPDAAMLPPIPGRGYIQVGGGPLTELQSAYSGNDYTDDKPDPVYSTEEVLAALGVSEELKPTKLINWIVGAAAAEARRQNIPKQFKPWPDPLPKQLPLNKPVDASYIAKGKLGKHTVLNPKVAEWLSGNAAWTAPAPHEMFNLRATLGVIDNPYLSEQRLLVVDLSGDPLAVFGASGRGKTTFLKSLILSLAAERSPADLHIYALDFGRGGLKAFRHLPHMGGIVDVGEEERVERLMRMIRATIDERQQKMQAYDSLVEFNQKNPNSAFAPVLVVIDNVSEFKETYERYLPDLLAMVRDGRSFGVYFVVTAALPNDIPLKLFNLLSQRITFTQSDSSEYTTIVGRGWSRFNDDPGRGLVVEVVNDAPMPLEFQTAVPVGETEADQYRELAQRMAQMWDKWIAENATLKLKRARPVEPLPALLDLASVLKPIGEAYANKAVAVGVNDLDREPTLLEFGRNGPHLIVIGPPVTGKTTTMRSLALSLAHSYGPEQIGLILIDPSDASRRFYNYGGSEGRTLADLPHVLATVGNAKEYDAVVKRLRAEYDEEVIARLRGNLDVFAPQDNATRSIFILFDHYDDAETFNKGSEGLNALAEIGKGKNLHLVLCGSSNIMRNSSDEVRRRAEQARYTLVLQDFEAVRYMGARGNFNVANKELPPGRGFLVKAVSATLVQMAQPAVEGKGGQTAQEQLDRLMSEIQGKWGERARWSYFADDWAPLEAAIRGETVAVAEAAVSAPPQNDAMAELAKLLAAQSGAAQGFFNSEIADGSNFASVEVPEENSGEKKAKQKE